MQPSIGLYITGLISTTPQLFSGLPGCRTWARADGHAMMAGSKPKNNIKIHFIWQPLLLRRRRRTNLHSSSRPPNYELFMTTCALSSSKTKSAINHLSFDVWAAEATAATDGGPDWETKPSALSAAAAWKRTLSTLSFYTLQWYCLDEKPSYLYEIILEKSVWLKKAVFSVHSAS